MAKMERVGPEETPGSYVERVSVGLWKTGFVKQYPDEGKRFRSEAIFMD